MCESCRSRKNAEKCVFGPQDAKIGVDTAENEPSKARGFLMGVGGGYQTSYLFGSVLKIFGQFVFSAISKQTLVTSLPRSG